MRGLGGLERIGGSLHYIHMFTSGNFMWFMEEHRNLHQLSQQGFESMNALVTSFFFQRTQRGSFTATNNPKSKLLPIARWLQRRLLWLCYSHEEIFIDCEYSNIINTATAESDLVDVGYGLNK
jgi:hypothetical protein